MEQLVALDTQAGFNAEGRQYLTFRLGQEQYGVEILRVQEIKGYSAITPIPNTPAYVKGVMDLRGIVVPVVDLRAKLAMSETPYDHFTVVIVVRAGTRILGLVVDAVSDVLNIPRADIQPTPDFGVEADARFITGIAKAGDKLVTLLDIDTVLGADGTGPLGSAN